MSGLDFTKAVLNCGCPVLTDTPCEKCCDHETFCPVTVTCDDCGSDMTERLALRAQVARDSTRAER